MKVDVLLPFHIHNLYLEMAINSVSESQDIDVRLILIDDSRTQDYEPKLREGGVSHIELVRTGGGTGYGNSLKVGSEAIQGDVVGLFNSDDLMATNRLVTQVRSLENHEISIVGMQRIQKNGKKISSLTGELNSSNYDYSLLTLGSYGANATWVMRKHWWERWANFDSQPALDWRIALKAFPNSSVHWNPERLYYYRKHSTQVTAKRETIFSEYTEIYIEWKTLLARLEIDGGDPEIFSLIATPWVDISMCNGERLFEFYREFMKFSLTLEPQLRRNIDNILRRRFLNASLRSSANLKTRKMLAKFGQKEIFPVLKDLVKLSKL